MTDWKEVTEEMMKNYEDEFFKENGFIMNSKQKKILRKNIEKIIERKKQNIDNSL